MIPLDPDKPLRVTVEKDGVTYLLAVLTEDKEEQYKEICGLYKDGDEESNKKYAIALINFFLIGWEGKNIPTFPTNGNPARYFVNVAMKIEMVNFILDNIDKIKGVSTEEIKN